MSIALGPLGISLERLLFVLAFFVAWFVGWLVGRRKGVSVETALSQMLLGGVLSARIAFIVAYREDYGLSPSAWLNIRDGGFLPWFGLLVALLIGGFHLWRFPKVRRPLLAAVAAATATVALTLGPLQVMQATRPTLPELHLVSLQGEEVSLPELGGRPVVLNLWATWCPPCRREMPVLAEAQEQFGDIRFIFVNQGESGDTVSQFLKKQNLELDNILLDFRSAASVKLGARAMPTTFFFDADGQMVDSHLGELSMATLKQGLKRFQPSEKED